MCACRVAPVASSCVGIRTPGHWLRLRLGLGLGLGLAVRLTLALRFLVLFGLFGGWRGLFVFKDRDGCLVHWLRLGSGGFGGGPIGSFGLRIDGGLDVLLDNRLDWLGVFGEGLLELSLKGRVAERRICLLAAGRVGEALFKTGEGGVVEQVVGMLLVFLEGVGKGNTAPFLCLALFGEGREDWAGFNLSGGRG